MKHVWWTAVALVGCVGAGAALFVASGIYDISATRQHIQPVYSLLETTMHRSVQQRARDLQVPPLEGAGRIERGALCYRAHCVQCHGGPGTAQDVIGRSMQPLPGPLVDASERWSPAELYWITRHGIKMSGMPAWQHHIADDDLWALVAFLQQLPQLTAAEFRAAGHGPHANLSSSSSASSSLSPAPAGAQPPYTSCLAPERADDPQPGDAQPRDPQAGDPIRGRQALTQFACNACHMIPGVTGSTVHVGPSLAGIGRRSLIAGSVANTPEQMQRWIREPQGIRPETAMPDMQVGEQDARDMAAYLATLR